MSYYVQLQVVSQSVGALHANQNGVLLLGAEPHGEPVSPGAGAVVGRPGVRDEGPSFPKYVRGPS